MTKDVDFTTQITKQETLLTKEMLESGDWKNIDFKPYNFNSKVGLSEDPIVILLSYNV